MGRQFRAAALVVTQRKRRVTGSVQIIRRSSAGGGFHFTGRTAPRRGGDKGRAGGGMMQAAFRRVSRDRQQGLVIPLRPAMTRGGSMCAEQAADLRAAQNGNITWAQYHQKWSLSL
jgi:hypothetical protein